MTLLSLDSVTVRFGGHTAVDGVSLEVPEESITGLIGPNGAGKTTLFNVISGLQPASAGNVSFGGKPINAASPTQRARFGLARTFQRLELFTSLTVSENIKVAGEIRDRWSVRKRSGSDVEAETTRIIDLLGLQAVADAEVGSVPTGTARVVELGRALMTRPRLLLLDEPASGQNDNETAEFGELLKHLVDDGIAVFLVEHDMSLVMSTCEKIHVLDFGSIIASGTPQEIQVDERVISAYLGGGT